MLPLAFAWFASALFAASLGFFLYVYLFTFGVAGPQAHSSPWRPLLVNTALFTVFALHHSLFARTRLKQFVNALVSPALERSVYALVASVLFLLVCALWQPVPGVLYAVPAPWRWAGYAVQAIGMLLTFAGSRALDMFDLSGVRQVQEARTGGRPPRDLQTGGVYRIVRHPVYFGWVLLVLGAPEMTFTRFSFAAISVSYLALAIPLEERSLLETFGPIYEAYRRQVRWRMVPGIY